MNVDVVGSNIMVMNGGVGRGNTVVGLLHVVPLSA